MLLLHTIFVNVLLRTCVVVYRHRHPVSACIAAAQKLVLDQQAYKRKGNKHAQGMVMEQPDAEGEPGTHGTQVASDAPLSPARLLWHILT